MANKSERDTDRWVDGLLKDAGIELEAEKSSIREIQEALKTASKKGTGKIGKPEYIGVVKDFIIVIEDKPTIDKHIKLDGTLISMETNAIVDYAVNGALFYAQHLANIHHIIKLLLLGYLGMKRNTELARYMLMIRNIIENFQR